MARKTRIEYEGALYHVIIRGNQQQNIFRDQEDFQAYPAIVESYKQRYKFLLYAYVLMSNHVHLLIETKTTPLSKIQQGINQRYTAYFNKKYTLVGHIFQGRYKAILCDRDAYLLTLIKYIHLNPLRAGIVDNVAVYEWSSYSHYVTGKQSGLIDDAPVLRMFSDNPTTARRLFKAYLTETEQPDKKDIYNTADQRILGDEAFVERIKMNNVFDVHGVRRKNEYSLPEISDAIERVYGVNLDELRGKGKRSIATTAKTVMSLVANEYGYKNKETAEFIQKDTVSVTKHLKAKEELRPEMERLISALKVNK